MSPTEFHLDYQRFDREQNLKKRGCVCRAAASITQAPLTPDQEDLCLAQTFEHDEAVRNLNRLQFTGEIPDEIIRQTRRETIGLNISQIKTFISSLRNQPDTPAGRELSQINVEFHELTPKEIRKVCKRGNQVVVITHHEGHAAHIEPKDKNKFTALK